MRLCRSERGSLPMVMLAILVMSSLVTLLAGTVVTGQNQTRFDQGFEQSLQVAETGVERMINLIRSGQRADSFNLPGVSLPLCTGTNGLLAVLGECWVATSAGGARYKGTAVFAGGRWDLVASGAAANGTIRTVAVTVRRESAFGVAAFGNIQMVLNGGNAADSFDSRVDSSICVKSGAPARPLSPSDSTDTRMCKPTGNGVVSTNGELYLLGGTTDSVNRVEIHYAKEKIASPLVGATGFCAGVTLTCTSPKLKYFRDPIVLLPDPFLAPEDLVNKGAFSGPVLEPGRQLYTNVRLDTNTLIKGTPSNPTILYITGTLTVPNAAVVNFEKGADGQPKNPNPSPGLLIFSAGIGPALGFGNHSSFSGAVFAPRATFSGGSAGNVYGSMMVGSFNTSGSWNFHYDDALGEVKTNAQWKVSGWSER